MSTSEQDAIELMKEKVWEFLREKGYVAETFDGDFETWISLPFENEVFD